MSDSLSRYHTLATYQQFLRHPDPIIRGWAADCLEEQYPLQAADSFVHLLTYKDNHLQISATRAIDTQGDARFEPALLAAWPHATGGSRNWMTITLGKLQSPAALSELITAVETVTEPLSIKDDMDNPWLPSHAAAQALGHYPDEPARTTLWQALERYPVDDRLTHNLVEGLLRHIRPAEIPRLWRRWLAMEPGGESYWTAWRAMPAAAGVGWLTEQLLEPLTDDWLSALDYLEFWFSSEVSFTPEFETVMEAAAERNYEAVLPALLTEFQRLTTAHRDDVPAWVNAWQAGQPLAGYRWRMALAHQWLTTLAAHPPQRPARYQIAVAFGLALLAQAVVDQDDETALQAAPNEMFRQATLLNILGSTRPNVLPDVVSQVAKLGPGVVPHLIEILEDANIWGWLRALPAIEQIARTYPAAANPAVSAILNLVYIDQSDEVLDAAAAALIAIGPGAVEGIAARLGQDYVYDIFVGHALANIPTEASVAAWLGYVAGKPALEETGWEYLTDLGHPAAIPFLRDNFNWRSDPHLCTALYTLAIVTDYEGAELSRWQAAARQSYLAFKNWNPTKAKTVTKPAKTTPPSRQAKQQRKKKRKQAKAQRKKQQKKKKRRR